MLERWRVWERPLRKSRLRRTIGTTGKVEIFFYFFFGRISIDVILILVSVIHQSVLIIKQEILSNILSHIYLT
jgi:hypothetical protein